MKFSKVPQVKFNRTKFDLSHNLKTTFNVGDLVPLDCQEVLPGDSFSNKTTAVVRVTSSFIKVPMDNLYMDIHHFFVPLRLCYEDAEKIFGNPNPSAYETNTLKDVPSITGIIEPYTVGDYFGLPVGAEFETDSSVNVLPFRAFALIYNQWFRNENVVDETFVNLTDNTSSEQFNELPWSANNYLGKLPKVNKIKDYFTSCLPSPQKGDPVTVPLGEFAPVVGRQQIMENLWTTNSSIPFGVNNGFGQDSPVGSTSGSGVVIPSYFYAERLSGFEDAQNLNLIINSDNSFGNKDGLYTDLSQATSMNVNDIRLAFALQKMLERDALYGSRYNEYLLGHFGVSSPDARLQFTEYLGGGRIPIAIQQVNQTSQPSEESPLGAVAGYSLSAGYSKYSKGFVEHGFVITVGCVKQKHSYSQGVPKMFMRKNRNDFYDPLFATLGEQPVYRSEIKYESGPLKDEVLGYNEAWADYRYRPAQITAGMRSGSDTDLDIWHFGDFYDSAPVLSQRFVEESADFVDRTLSVPSSSMPNFIADVWFDTKAIRVMPAYSVPGLVDHH